MYKLNFNSLYRSLLFASFTAVLFACVMPGHRQQLVEENIQLRIESPTLQQKQKIRFNEALTTIESLPADTYIELDVKENKHYELIIRNINNKIDYDYNVEGKDTVFDGQAQKWFAKYVPMIAEAVTTD